MPRRPHPRLGQTVAAFIEAEVDLGAGREAFIERLQALCAANLATYKTPVDWFVVTTMPRNAMGKIVKAQLAEQMAAQPA